MEPPLPSHSSDTPSWIANPVLISSKLDGDDDLFAVESFDLDERIKSVLFEHEMASLFPVQEAVLRYARTACDLCVCAPTGSGKTLAYALSIVNGLAGRNVLRLRALIVVPGRELAGQVFHVLQPFAEALGLFIGLAVGQSSFGAEQKRLGSSNASSVGESGVDILIATPGRLMHHLEFTRGFTLQHLEWLVLDEADRLLDDSAKHWLDLVNNSLDPCSGDKKGPARAESTESINLFDHSPHSTHPEMSYRPTLSDHSHMSVRKKKDAAYKSSSWVTPLQRLLFSATLTRNPAKFAELALKRPVYIAIAAGPVQVYTLPRELREFLYIAPEERKPLYVMHLLEEENITRSICFTKSVESTERLVLLLEGAAVGTRRIAAFSAKISAEARASTLRNFNAGLVDLLVCSDAAARGLDLTQVACVINYDAPRFLKTYVHRVGRTARAGNTGRAFTIVAMHEAYHFKQMMAKGRDNVKIPVLKLPKPRLQALSSQMEQALLQLDGTATRAKRAKDETIRLLIDGLACAPPMQGT